MPGVEIWQIAVSLGVPGLALLIFYLIMRSFGFTFAQISPPFAAIIAIIFILVVGFIVYTALTRFSVSNPPPQTVRHIGKLGALQSGLMKSAIAKVTIRFADDSNPLIRELYVNASAENHVELINKICQSNATCITCNFENNIFNIATKLGSCIKKSRINIEDDIFICSSGC